MIFVEVVDVINFGLVGWVVLVIGGVCGVGVGISLVFVE